MVLLWLGLRPNLTGNRIHPLDRWFLPLHSACIFVTWTIVAYVVSFYIILSKILFIYLVSCEYILYKNGTFTKLLLLPSSTFFFLIFILFYLSSSSTIVFLFQHFISSNCCLLNFSIWFLLWIFEFYYFTLFNLQSNLTIPLLSYFS